MNDFLAHLRELARLLTHDLAWGTPASIVTLALTAIVLFFGAGTVARVIFGKDTGLVRTFLAALLVLAAGLAATAATMTWTTAPFEAAVGIGGAVALAVVWVAAKILRVGYGPAFGILLFALALAGGTAYGAGQVVKLLQKNAATLEKKVARP